MGTGRTRNALLCHPFLQIDVEDLEEGPVVNGERPDCLLADAALSGNKRRSQSGSAVTKKDGEVAVGEAPPEQVAEGPTSPEQVPRHTCSAVIS